MSVSVPADSVVAEPAIQQEKWSNMRDDDDNGFLNIISGNVRTLTNYTTEGDVKYKVEKKSKLYRLDVRTSKLAEERKSRMCSSSGGPFLSKQSKAEQPAKLENECFIELPKSVMRKAGGSDSTTNDYDNDDHTMVMADDRGELSSSLGGLGLAFFRREGGVKEKFNVLRRLDEMPLERIEGDLVKARNVSAAAAFDLEDRAADRGAHEGTRSDQMKEENTVRVTNLSEEVTETDLKDLFGRIGEIKQVYLPKNKTTKAFKGFAFVTYQNKESARNAIKALDRFGYDNLLLKVEWSKAVPKL